MTSCAKIFTKAYKFLSILAINVSSSSLNIDTKDEFAVLQCTCKNHHNITHLKNMHAEELLNLCFEVRNQITLDTDEMKNT